MKWIVKSVNLACNTGTNPFKDNEAVRWKAKEAKVNKAKIKEAKKKEDEKTRERGRRQGTSTPSWETPATEGHSVIRDAKWMEIQNM